MVQTLQGALNLCIDGNDVITFATSDNQNKTYFYMQSKNIMVQVDWERRGWIKVKPRVYELCLNSSECICTEICFFFFVVRYL